jgi:hypothetical protein
MLTSENIGVDTSLSPVSTGICEMSSDLTVMDERGIESRDPKMPTGFRNSEDKLPCLGLNNLTSITESA